MHSCAPLRISVPVGIPNVRVGLLAHQHSVVIETSGRYRLTDGRNRPLYKSDTAEEWTVTLERAKAARFSYQILLAVAKDKKAAGLLAEKLGLSRSEIEIFELGDQLKVGSKIVADGRSYRVLFKREFQSESEASDFRNKSINLKAGKVIRKITQPAAGIVVLTNEKTRQRVAVRNAARVAGTIVKIKNVKVGNGFHWAHNEDRSYRGVVEFMVDADGSLLVVNVLSLEDYLRGVVPGEMPQGFPEEALKAQTVAARSFFLSQFGRVHQDEAFDVCDDVHCQVYAGASKVTERTDDAVRGTRGLVLTSEGTLCRTFFASVCGGHTERIENVWSTDQQPYLKGVVDFDGEAVLPRGLDLTQNDVVQLWVSSSPNVFCNLQNRQVPSAFEFTKKYFRWEQRYKNSELSKIIKETTGRQVGGVIDLIPVKRGVSGRIIELEILGTKAKFTINGELAIRKALARSTLYSSCFVVEKSQSDGLPNEFVIKGAGWGHGVGMCQTGAGAMALDGKSFDQILYHYYPGTRVTKLY